MWLQETSWSSQPGPGHSPALPHLPGGGSDWCQQNRRVPGGDAGPPKVGNTCRNSKLWLGQTSTVLTLLLLGTPHSQQRTVSPTQQETTYLPNFPLTLKTPDPTNTEVRSLSVDHQVNIPVWYKHIWCLLCVSSSGEESWQGSGSAGRLPDNPAA